MAEVSASTWGFLVLAIFALLTVGPQVKLLLSILTGFSRTYKYLLPFSAAFGERLYGPLVAEFTLLYVYFLIVVIPWHETSSELENALLKGLGVLSLLVSFWLARRLVDFFVFVAKYLLRNNVNDGLLISFTNDIIVFTHLVLLFFIGYFMLVAFFVLIKLQTVSSALLGLLFSYNLFSLTVALALIAPIRDAMAAVNIITDGHIKYGDWIEINQVCGKVNAVGVQRVELIQADHSSAFIPCSEFLSYDLYNLSERKYRQVVIELDSEEIQLMITPDHQSTTREGALRELVKSMERIVSILELLNWCISLDEKVLRISWDIPAGNLSEFVKQKTTVMLKFTSELENFKARMMPSPEAGSGSESEDFLQNKLFSNSDQNE